MQIGQRWLKLLISLVIYGAIIYSQIYRYRRVSTPAQRQQTKWVILGVTVAIGIIIGILAITFLIPSYLNSNAFGAIYYYFYHLARRLALDPDLHRVLDFALSTLRHRLADQSHAGIW